MIQPVNNTTNWCSIPPPFKGDIPLLPPNPKYSYSRAAH